MHYILNETRHIIAADSSLLALCGRKQINELVEDIILKNISLTIQSNKTLTITTKKTEYQFPIQQTALKSVLGTFTLITIDTDKQKSKHLSPHNTVHPQTEAYTKPIQPTPSKNTPQEAPLVRLHKRASAQTLDPIIIDIDEASQEIGISKEDFTLFFTDYINTALEVEPDLLGTDKEKKHNAINTLSHLSGVLHLESINQIMVDMKESTPKTYTEHVNKFYDTLARVKTIDKTSTSIPPKKETKENFSNSIDRSATDSIYPNTEKTTPINEMLQHTIEEIPAVKDTMAKGTDHIASLKEKVSKDLDKGKNFIQNSKENIQDKVTKLPSEKETLFNKGKDFIHDTQSSIQDKIEETPSIKDTINIGADKIVSLKEDAVKNIDITSPLSETSEKASIFDKGKEFILPIKDTIQGKVEKVPSVKESIENDTDKIVSLKEGVVKNIDITSSPLSDTLEKASIFDKSKEFILPIKDTIQEKRREGPSLKETMDKNTDKIFSVKEEVTEEIHRPSPLDTSLEKESIFEKGKNFIHNSKESIQDKVDEVPSIQDTFAKGTDKLASLKDDVVSEKKSIFEKGKDFIRNTKENIQDKVEDIPSVQNALDKGTEQIVSLKDDVVSEKKSIFEKDKNFTQNSKENIQDKVDGIPSVQDILAKGTDQITSRKEDTTKEQHQSKDSIHHSKENIQDKVEDTLSLKKDSTKKVSTHTNSYENLNLAKIAPIDFIFSIDDTSKRLGLPKYLIHEFMLNVIDQTRNKINDMVDAYKKNDLETVQKTAHLLKDISSNLRITPLSESLHKIELCESQEALPALIKDYWGHFLSFEKKVNSEKTQGK